MVQYIMGILFYPKVYMPLGDILKKPNERRDDIEGIDGPQVILPTIDIITLAAM